MNKRSADMADFDASVAKQSALCDKYYAVLDELSAGNIEALLAMESWTPVIDDCARVFGIYAILSTMPLTLEQFQRLEANIAPIPAREIGSLLRWQCMSLRRAPFSEQLLLHLVARADTTGHESNLLVMALRAGPIVLPVSVRDAIAVQCNHTLTWLTIPIMVTDFTLEMAGFKLIAGDTDCTRDLPYCFLRCARHYRITENALNAMVLHHQKVGGAMTWLEKACRRLSTTHTSWLISKLQMYGRGLVTPEWVAAATRHTFEQNGDDLFAATLVLQTLRALLPPAQ